MLNYISHKEKIKILTKKGLVENVDFRIVYFDNKSEIKFLR